MFAKCIIPLVVVAAVATNGTASAQARPMGRPGGQTFVAPRHVPKPIVHHAPVVVHKPFVQPHFVAKPAFLHTAPIFVPPVGHHRGHHGHHHNHWHHHGHFPPFWGGLWGSHPAFVYPLPGFWFAW